PTTTPTTPSPPTTTPTLGVLLPLSGPLAPMGRALKGVAPLAAAPRVKGGARLIFHEIDDAARLDGILRALAEEGAFGAVGLFDRAQALAAAKAAREINLPLIMLTLEDRALGAPGPVWRALHTPPLVARTAAGGGLERGGKVAAVVRPDRRFAARLEAWFSEAWRGGGGRVIQGISWPPEKPDWPSVARRVKALEADTLFIPCDAEDAAQLMSHLAAQKIWSRGLKPRFKGDAVREIVVLGISEWYTPQLLQRARRYLEGALIPAPFLAETPRGARFSALIREALSREASAFDALLYDALLALTQAATRSSDGGAVERLRRVEAVEAGVTSGLNFTRPEALGGLYLVEVYQGQFIPMR
ncbi:ABC transporter substrate-binding protein, partial [Myxococcota bacterium]|nr:ABC transporter substrate-binding protein [Myxococcota bacterium]